MDTGSESVVINNFWRRPAPVFHARHDPGTRCDPENKRGDRPSRACGHALPRRLAELIAKPCSRCYPTTQKEI